jgi:hypothetical protein
MAIELRVLDDGAWVSVDNRRRVSTSEIWPFVATDFCRCERSSVLLEAFTDVGVDGCEIVADGVGRCVDCGDGGGFAGLGVGRVVDGAFRPYPPGAVRASAEPRC